MLSDLESTKKPPAEAVGIVKSGMTMLDCNLTCLAFSSRADRKKKRPTINRVINGGIHESI
jgi:hypothetical protein